MRIIIPTKFVLGNLACKSHTFGGSNASGSRPASAGSSAGGGSLPDFFRRWPDSWSNLENVYDIKARARRALCVVGTRALPGKGRIAHPYVVLRGPRHSGGNFDHRRKLRRRLANTRLSVTLEGMSLGSGKSSNDPSLGGFYLWMRYFYGNVLLNSSERSFWFS